MFDSRLQSGLLLALLLSARLSAAETGEATAGPLAAVQRKIGKEPKYEGKPRYVMLVLGSEGRGESLAGGGWRAAVCRSQRQWRPDR
jgi:hypothetical protein